MVGNLGTVPQIPELATRGAIMWNAFVEAFDRQLADHRWAVGEAYSFADITALVTVDFARAAKLEVAARHANMLRWHEAASARPSAKA